MKIYWIGKDNKIESSENFNPPHNAREEDLEGYYETLEEAKAAIVKMNKVSLYHIDEAEIQINKILEECDDDDNILVQDSLNALKLDKENKLMAFDHVINNKKALINGGKEMIKQIKTSMEKYERDVERLKNNILDSMERTGTKSFETPIGKFTSVSSKSIDPFDETLIPKKYFKETTKVTVRPDKKEIKKAIDSGENIQGARYIHKNNLRINNRSI